MKHCLFILVLILVAGCAHREPSRLAGLTPPQARVVAAKLAVQRESVLRDDLRSAFALHPPRNILLLSGGDAHGAFGCGVLAGWRKANPSRPQFDVVTGVSTGALMAALAFLGEPCDDEQLRDAYLHIHDGDIFDGPLGGPPDAVFDTAPLRKLIARYVTPDTIRRIAAEHRKGRRLYVATAELDTGSLVLWPMSRIANQAVKPNGELDDGQVERFRSVLLAAASIPMMFPPVDIDGGLHVDAGLRAALILHEAMLGDAPDPPEIWAIFNGPLGSTPQSVDADLLHIGVRSLTVYSNAIESLSLREVALLAESHSPACRFHWISEPPADTPEATAPDLTSAMFDPADMKRRYDCGQTLGQRESSWHDGAPQEN